MINNYGGPQHGGYGSYVLGGGYQPRGGFGGPEGLRGGYQSNMGYGNQGDRHYVGSGYQTRNGGGFGGQGGPPQGNNDNSVFVINLGDADQRNVEDLFRSFNLRPMRVRVFTDETVKSNGAAFIDFKSSNKAQNACKMDGREIPGSRTRLKINPANSKPGPR